MSYDTGVCKQAFDNSDTIIHTSASAATAWTPVYLDGVGYIIPQASLAASVKGAYYKRGIFSFIVTSGVTLAAGDKVYYDSAATTIQLVAPSAGYLIGTCIKGGTGNASGTVVANVDINVFEQNGDFSGLDISTTGLVLSGTTATVITATDDVVLTAAQVVTKLLLIDTGGSDRLVTTPTAALLVAAIGNAKVGSSFVLTVRNTADADEDITITGGTDVAISGTATVLQNATKDFIVVVENVTSGSEAITMYSNGTKVF